MEKESSLIFSIIFIAIFLVVFLLGLVLIIGGLNQGNTQAGQTITTEILSQSLYNMKNSSSYIETYNISSPICSIISVKDLAEITIDPSNYTINNCQINYNP
jgi:hypothetical protein